MADIFISYAREDVDAAQRLAASLEKRGWSVFWDRHITAGRRYTDVISEELAGARCVITLWSRAANDSDWVLDEAEEARKRHILAPARIEALDPPMGFRRIHAADLLGWNGDEKHAGFQQLLLDIAHYVPAPAESPPRPALQASHAAGVANTFSARAGRRSAVGAGGARRLARPRSRLWHGLSGVAFGLGVWFAFFYFPILDRLTYLIPLSVRPLLNPLTAVLFALVGWLWSERQSLAHRWRRVSRVWVFAAPAGLLLFFLFDWLFVVHFPFQSGLMASEIIARPRIEAGKCPCTKEESDVACLTSLTLEPEELARCWDGSRRKLYGGLWSLTYLFALSGALSGLLLIRPGKAPLPEPAALQPAGGTGAGLFLSYSRRDREFAERLASDLRDHGVAVWSDSSEMAVGDSLPSKIEEAIGNSAWFGTVLSPDSIASHWVRAELDLALTMEIEGKLSILPILHEPCEIPLSLRRKVRADFTSSYEDGLEALLGGLGVASRLDRGV